MNASVFPLAFLPTIAYGYLWLNEPNPVIDLGEHYVRQTCRNRTYILGSQGVNMFVIPIIQGHSTRLPMYEVRIEYKQPWQRKYWQAIISGYQNAPYFEHYAPEIKELWFEQPSRLADYTLPIFRWLLKQIEPSLTIHTSEQYITQSNNDYRQTDFLNPSIYKFLPYHQVFSDRYNFCPNLSLFDLLCNKGPESFYVIQQKNFLE
ncbi:MAG: WbqC family protein [Candidatus Competibacteraceae bacterium]|nr:WbqC family protein [Candidatus Competibacteraceae bacterium]